MKKYLEYLKRYFDEKEKGDAIRLTKIQGDIRGLAGEMNRESQSWAAQIKAKDEQIEGAQVKMNEMEMEIDSLKRETESLREAKIDGKIVLNRKNQTEQRDSISSMKDGNANGTSAIPPSSLSLAGRLNTGPYQRLSSTIRRPITYDRSPDSSSLGEYPSHGCIRSTITYGYDEPDKQCPKCNKIFSNLKKYNYHVLKICVKPFQCHCGKVFGVGYNAPESHEQCSLSTHPKIK